MLDPSISSNIQNTAREGCQSKAHRVGIHLRSASASFWRCAGQTGSITWTVIWFTEGLGASDAQRGCVPDSPESISEARTCLPDSAPTTAHLGQFVFFAPQVEKQSAAVLTHVIAHPARIWGPFQMFRTGGSGWVNARSKYWMEGSACNLPRMAVRRGSQRESPRGARNEQTLLLSFKEIVSIDS
jgi:hypothetical protein